MQQLFENDFVKKIELRLVAEEARFIDREVFQQGREFGFAFMTGQQAIVAVKGIKPADFQAAIEPVLKEVRAALIKIHAAFLVDEALQQLELCFSDLDLNAR